jgi:hypothetical protein
MSRYTEALVIAMQKHHSRCYWKNQMLQFERDYGKATFRLEIGGERAEDKESALDFFSRLVREDHIYRVNYIFEEFFGDAWDDISAAAADGIHPFDD